MTKEIVRAICLISVTAGLYRNEDIETGIAFLGLMIVVIWAIPEIVSYILRRDKE